MVLLVLLELPFTGQEAVTEAMMGGCIRLVPVLTLCGNGEP